VGRHLSAIGRENLVYMEKRGSSRLSMGAIERRKEREKRSFFGPGGGKKKGGSGRIKRSEVKGGKEKKGEKTAVFYEVPVILNFPDQGGKKGGSCSSSSPPVRMEKGHFSLQGSRVRQSTRRNNPIPSGGGKKRKGLESTFEKKREGGCFFRRATINKAGVAALERKKGRGSRGILGRGGYQRGVHTVAWSEEKREKRIACSRRRGGRKKGTHNSHLTKGITQGEVIEPATKSGKKEKKQTRSSLI